MSLDLCDHCKGRGLPKGNHGNPYRGMCPRCQGSGFQNATAADAEHVVRMEAEGYNEEARRAYLKSRMERARA